MAPLVFIALATAMAFQVAQSRSSSSYQSTGTTTFSFTLAPSRIVTFAGATGVGKSTTINALANNNILKVGPEHGTTTNISDVDYEAGYLLRDTPGLMDEIDFAPIIWPSLKMSKLIVYVVTGQLYGPERKIIEEIYAKQFRWNRSSSSANCRELVLYVNKIDTKKCMDSFSYKREKEAIKSQVKQWIPENRIVFGSASPIENGVRKSAQITELRQLINDCCDIQKLTT